VKHANITDIPTYLQRFANELDERVVAKYPPLYQPGDPVLPALARLRRKPFPAQTLAIMGVCGRMDEFRSAAVMMMIAECGTGKTLVALASVFARARGKDFTAIFMVPHQLVEKTCRECSLTLPGVRVFIIDGLRNGVSSNGYTGVNEVRFRNGRIVREGLKTSLSDIRLAKRAPFGAPSLAVNLRRSKHIRDFPRASQARNALATCLPRPAERSLPRQCSQC